MIFKIDVHQSHVIFMHLVLSNLCTKFTRATIRVKKMKKTILYSSCKKIVHQITKNEGKKWICICCM